MQCEGAAPQAYQEVRLSMQVAFKLQKQCASQCASQCAAILYRMASKWVVSAQVGSMYFCCLQCSFSEQLDWNCELIAAVIRDAGVNLWTCWSELLGRPPCCLCSKQNDKLWQTTFGVCRCTCSWRPAMNVTSQQCTRCTYITSSPCWIADVCSQAGRMPSAS